jgi:Mg2+ and Co2+ transporter CorA
MNTGLPGKNSIHAFWVIIGVMVIVLVSMLALFRKRGWL